MDETDKTLYLWLTREMTTLSHLRGLILGLENSGAVDLAQVKIMVVTEDRGVNVPPGVIGPAGVLPGGVLTVNNLPPEGILTTFVN